jgi:hypothetical protein
LLAAAGVAVKPVSVSVGLRGTSTQPSCVIEALMLLVVSQSFPAAALAALSETSALAGNVDWGMDSV